MKDKNIWLFFLLVFCMLMAVGCTPQSAGAEPAAGLGVQPEEASPSTGSGAAITEAMVFSLQPSVVDRRIVYVGVGGDIDGLINPDLVVQPGVRVQVTLIGVDGMPHNVSFPDFSATSAMISSKGKTSEVSFEVKEDQIGTYAYFCTWPGHRQAGQEGQLIVSDT